MVDRCRQTCENSTCQESFAFLAVSRKSSTSFSNSSQDSVLLLHMKALETRPQATKLDRRSTSWTCHLSKTVDKCFGSFPRSLVCLSQRSLENWVSDVTCERAQGKGRASENVAENVFSSKLLVPHGYPNGSQ